MNQKDRFFAFINHQQVYLPASWPGITVPSVLPQLMKYFSHFPAKNPDWEESRRRVAALVYLVKMGNTFGCLYSEYHPGF